MGLYHGFSSKKWGFSLFNMGRTIWIPERVGIVPDGDQSVELLRILQRWGEMWKPGGFEQNQLVISGWNRRENGVDLTTELTKHGVSVEICYPLVIQHSHGT